eukprot:1694170-Prymnesium_polylepis.1
MVHVEHQVEVTQQPRAAFPHLVASQPGGRAVGDRCDVAVCHAGALEALVEPSEDEAKVLRDDKRGHKGEGLHDLLVKLLVVWVALHWPHDDADEDGIHRQVGIRGAARGRQLQPGPVNSE